MKEEKIKLMRLACLLCDRATCNYKVGCLVVKEGRIILKAFNEILPGEKYCRGVCIREKREYSGGQRIEIVCTLHAEAAVVAQAAAKGIPLEGVEIYVSTFPCYICAKLLTRAGIKKLYFMSDYDGNDGLRFFKAAEIEVEKIPEEVVWKASPDGACRNAA